MINKNINNRLLHPPHSQNKVVNIQPSKWSISTEPDVRAVITESNVHPRSSPIDLWRGKSRERRLKDKATLTAFNNASSPGTDVDCGDLYERVAMSKKKKQEKKKKRKKKKKGGKKKTKKI